MRSEKHGTVRCSSEIERSGNGVSIDSIDAPYWLGCGFPHIVVIEIFPVQINIFSNISLFVLMNSKANCTVVTSQTLGIATVLQVNT